MHHAVAIDLQVIGIAQAGIRHDGAATARFIGRQPLPDYFRNRRQVHAVEGMCCAQLMADFMGYVVDNEGITLAGSVKPVAPSALYAPQTVATLASPPPSVASTCPMS